MHENCEQIKTQRVLSNTAKLLKAYMQATGIACAKTLAEALDIPMRTIQRLKLDIACATDGVVASTDKAPQAPRVAQSSQLTNATSATDGVFEAPQAPPVASRARVEETNLLTNLENRLVIKPPLPPKRGVSPSTNDALEAFHAYNATALRCGLQQAGRMTPDRQRKIIARLKDYGLDGWKVALANIEKSAFLKGQNDRGWRATLDFVLQPSSFSKVHDGAYNNDDPKPAAPAAKKPTYGVGQPLTYDTDSPAAKAQVQAMLADFMRGSVVQ